MEGSNHVVGLCVPKKVIVGHGVGVVHADVEVIVVDEAAVGEGLWESFDDHGPVVQSKIHIDINFLSLYSFLVSYHRSPFQRFQIRVVSIKVAKSKLAIVEVNKGELGTCLVLLYFFQLDVLVILASYLFLKHLLIGNQRKHPNPVRSLVLLRHRDHQLRIVCDEHANDWELGHDYFLS